MCFPSDVGITEWGHADVTKILTVSLGGIHTDSGGGAVSVYVRFESGAALILSLAS